MTYVDANRFGRVDHKDSGKRYPKGNALDGNVVGDGEEKRRRRGKM